MFKKTPTDSLDDATEIIAPFNGSLTDAVSASHAQARGTLASLGESSETASDLAQGTQVSQYVIEKRIGAGAMGAVYAARQPTIDKHVAIKVMNPRMSDQQEAVDRFIDEARAVAAIEHPGIVDVFGFGSLPDGRLYLIMELLHGESLHERLTKGLIELKEAVDILDQIARALEVAHDRGVAHRDLKPENIFLVRVPKEPKPIVKILDFGLAKLIDDETRVRRTRSGQLLGTPLYMSPEQCRAKNVSHRTDIYALGCVAYELLCGRPPFNFDNVAELIAAHLTEDPARPRVFKPQLPLALDGLLFSMLTKRPERRPSLAMARAVFTAVIADLSAETRTSMIQVPRPQKRGLMIAGSFVVIAGVVAGMAMVGRPRAAIVPVAPIAQPAPTIVVTEIADASVPVSVADDATISKPVIVPIAATPKPKTIKRATPVHVVAPSSTSVVTQPIVVPPSSAAQTPDKTTINPFHRKAP